MKGILFTTIFYLISLFLNHLLAQSIDESYQPQIKGEPYLYSTAIQEDGKIIVTGWIKFQGDKEIGRLVRFNKDGSLDSSFNPPNFKAYPTRVFVNKRGKILISDNNELVTPLNQDGSIDENFKEKWKESSAETNPWKRSEILLAEDSTFLIVNQAHNSYIIERIKYTGEIDNNFEKIEVDDPGFIYSCIRLNDEKLAISGEFKTVNGKERIHIAVFDNNGKIDESFNTGSGFTNINGNLKLASHQGKIIAYGRIDSYNKERFPTGVVQLNNDGTIDDNFSMGPISGFSFSEPIQITENKEGKLLVAGIQFEYPAFFEIRRFNPDGSFDLSYNSLKLKLFSGEFLRLNFDNEENLHIYGHFNSTNDKPIISYAKFDPTGKLFEEFDLKLRKHGEVRKAIKLQDGGTLIYGNFTDIGNEPISNYPKIARLDKFGKLNKSVNYAFSPRNRINCFTELPGGEIIFGGSFYDSTKNNTNILLKYDREGILMEDFIVKSLYGGVSDIEIFENNDILITGNFQEINGYNITKIAKLKPDGSLDESFNRNKILENGWSPQMLALVGKNKIAVGGSWINNSRESFAGVTLLDSLGDKVESFKEIKNPVGKITALTDGKTNNFVFAGQSKENHSTYSKLYHFDCDKKVMDSTSFITKDYSNFNDILFLDSSNFILGGNFKDINGIQRNGLAKLGLNGKLFSNFNFNLDDRGEIFSVLREDKDHVLVFGDFEEINGQTFYSGARIKLTNSFPGSPSDTTFDITEDSSLLLTIQDLGFAVEDSEANKISLIYSSGDNYSISGNRIIPSLNFSGNLTIPTKITNGEDTVQTNLKISVQPINDPPQIEGLKYPIIIDHSKKYLISKDDFVINDPDNSIEQIQLKILPGDTYDLFGDSIKVANTFSGEISVKVQAFDGVDYSKIYEFKIEVKDKAITKFKISGTLLTQPGVSINKGTIEVYQFISDDSINLVKSISLSHANSFEFEGEENGKYIIKAIPDSISYPELSPTFYGNKLTIEETEIIELSKDTSISITVQTKPLSTFKITGILTTQNGEPVNQGTIEVYQTSDDSTNLVQSISLTNKNTFEFEGEKDGNFILKAFPDSEKYPNLIPTYFGDALLFTEAEVIELSEDKLVTITLFEKTGEQTGSSTLEGLALETEGNEGGRLSQGFATEGTPIPDLLVYLLNKESAIVGLDTTDSNGLFQFENINSGEYKLAADYNNKPISLSNALFEITEDGQSLQLSLLVGDSLSVEITSITGLEDFEPIEGVTIYPNPVENVIQVNIQNQVNGNYELEILDITGKSLIRQRLKKSNQNMVESIDLAELTKGIYFLKIRKGNTLVVKRLVKG